MSSSTTPDAIDALVSRLPDLGLRDERRMRRRLEQLRRSGADTVPESLTAEFHAAAARLARRRDTVPGLSYPDLPVAAAKDDILAALQSSQVLVIAGETGSGKTTQLPKMCLEAGRGVRGRIGHTQPRRIAARAVADRIAEELGTPLGSAVGYQVRFTETVSADTLIKVMTDGILLAEVRSDKWLDSYDTLIVDEAHERSLNIDFLLGYLQQLLPRRPDLKLIITSATIDPGRFARHFGDVPVIEVSGRTYPVEVRYRPLVAALSDDADEAAEVAEEPKDQISAICDAVEELYLEGSYGGGGDILVFLSGEREIRDTADALARLSLRDTEVVPLYGRLSAAEQHRVFEAHSGRRVVLATNVAETSLTVPGIRYVVDPGTARISRYSSRLKVQRLPIEPISQASANQRKGRCGRVAEGICIRLYSEDDFLARPEFTDPEILRTSLASVILQMASLKLGDVAAFPFLDPPDKRQIRDGVALLEELGALSEGKLTPAGRQLAQFPVDPRLARMVLEADRNGCVREVLVLTAALSMQDPRERPVDKQQAADEKHARFADPTSDFAAYLNLWNHLQERQRELSSSAFRRLCKAEYLNYLRVREWQDLQSQLKSVAKSLGVTLNSTPAEAPAVHRSLLAGLLSHVGMRDADTDSREKGAYLGARGARFAVWPGSALSRKQPRWVMAAELVETSRLWARVCARIAPEDVEPLAGHLVKRTYSEPHWSKKQASVMAYEKVTLYGLPIVARRAVTYGRIDPSLSRELFLRHALVEGDWDAPHEFLTRNRKLLADAEELEHRVRRRGLLVDDDTLFAFYDQRVPEDVVSGRHFDRWWKTVRRTQPELLIFDPAMLLDERAADVRTADFPDTAQLGPVEVRLSYVFEPGADNDGVTVHIPLPMLNQVPDEGLDWQVPGLREELVTALLRSLPKELRRHFAPTPDTAARVLARLRPGEGPLLVELGHELYDMTGVDVPDDAWQPARLPAHLRPTYRIEDAGGKAGAESKDLVALKRRVRPQLRQTLAAAAAAVERTGLTDWTVGTVPREFSSADGAVRGFPALVDEGATVSLRVLATAEEQQRSMWRGIRRLLRLTTPSPLRGIVAGMSAADKLALSTAPHAGVPALLEDVLDAAADAAMAAGGGLVWDDAGFRALQQSVRSELPRVAGEVLPAVATALTSWQDVLARLGAISTPGLQPAVADMRAQLRALVYPGFLTATGAQQLTHLPRYLRAAAHRLDSLADNPARDRIGLEQIQRLQREYAAAVMALPEHRRDTEEVRAVRWMLEELRVSLFAQSLGTAYPVSEKRLLRAMEQLT